MRGQLQALLRRAASTQGRSKIDIDWDNLSFNLDHHGQEMFCAVWNGPAKGWEGQLQDYGPLSLMPSAQALNYGQSIFEGMKARRTAKDRIVLFRPEMNASRMKDGARRLCMPEVPQHTFINAVEETVRANSEYVPPLGKGALYIRPLLFGSGPILGLAPAPSYTFVTYCAAVGSYFKGGQLKPIDLVVENKFHRAAPGGMGGTKAAGNYSAVLQIQRAANAKGFADVVYLDCKTDAYLEEVSACNIFVVKGRTIKTPPLTGTILPGVTRDSILQLARKRGYDVKEQPIPVVEALEADEIFTTGTAVVVSPVGSLTHKGKRRVYGGGVAPTPVGLELYGDLTAIQNEQTGDHFGWVHPVC
ncbi:unnamed protein product [Ostreobium quekettii]|uniref:Branched-chain-amino-acid aminotransferase n=1 Tax=Ostreobium quekettii TaxID=121088 RepID=A0A8S1IZA4_9CHLO|nr:unnamed protein product [Ostreobium quekettii]|eukprot:evm.model.scf_1376.4 EVM.evm.TU.scf_1376.4   scf_1376:33013-37612(+)